MSGPVSRLKKAFRGNLSDLRPVNPHSSKEAHRDGTFVPRKMDSLPYWNRPRLDQVPGHGGSVTFMQTDTTYSSTFTGDKHAVIEIHGVTET